MDTVYPLLVVMGVSLVLMQLNQRRPSPVLALCNRWLRWFIFSFGVAHLLSSFGLSGRPFGLLFLTAALIWLLLETIYNWLAIAALSQSPVSLFPSYSHNPGGDEWPLERHILREREALRFKGFKLLQPLRTEIGGGIWLRTTIYEHPEHFVRAQMVFLPQPNGTVVLGCILTSLTASGIRLVTDNLHVPYGGFYPDHWSVERRPMTRSFLHLLERHQQRLRDTHDQAVAFSSSPQEDLDDSQRELDRLNTELGFLFPYFEREENGKITHEGRYRVWKEIWMLDYLGRSVRYS